MRNHVALGLALASLCCLAHAQLTAMIAVEPSRKKDSMSVSVPVIETSLGRTAGQPVSVIFNEDMGDAMRATRAGEHDVYIAPPQVAASALARGFELVGCTQDSERYVLVARAEIESLDALRGARLYLPPQDSIYSYMARGLLNASGLSLHQLKVDYGRFAMVGLVAIQIGYADAAVVSESEWTEWQKTQADGVKALAISSPVPGGLSVVVRKAMPAPVREKVSHWFLTSSSAAGMKSVAPRADPAQYKTVADLGYFTPTKLPGATIVTAAEVRQLVGSGAVIVDTRSEKEYKAKHIPQALFVPYHEKSLKDVNFDQSKDDFSTLATLDPKRPTIFSCNGAECWKSYKASRVAIERGFKTVYWFRGGLPEWESTGLPAIQD